jgi:diamine N-acetyltransferase
MFDITLRRITIEDVPVLAAIASTTFYDTFTGTCTEEDMQQFLQEYYNLAQVTKELSDPNDLFYFALVDGEPAGYIRFKEDYSGLPIMRQWKTMELKRLYVLQQYHGKGVAQKLIEFFIDWCKKENYTAMYLGVWEHNTRAQKFYTKYGFVNSGHTHAFPIGNTPQTDLWLWRFL